MREPVGADAERRHQVELGPAVVVVARDVAGGRRRRSCPACARTCPRSTARARRRRRRPRSGRRRSATPQRKPSGKRLIAAPHADPPHSRRAARRPVQRDSVQSIALRLETVGLVVALARHAAPRAEVAVQARHELAEAGQVLAAPQVVRVAESPSIVALGRQISPNACRCWSRRAPVGAAAPGAVPAEQRPLGERRRRTCSGT